MTFRPLLQHRRKDPIHMVSRRHNYFPRRFLWRGTHYDVHSVERAWTEMKRSGGQHFFRVRCSEGTFDIYQDISLNAWYLAAKVD
jgi:hypothetical protein